MNCLPPVLLAEDDEHDAFFMRRAFKLAQISHPLTVVPNGQEVIWYLTGQRAYTDRTLFPPPCLLLLDLKMPLMDGFDVLAWEKEQPPSPQKPPAIVLSCSGYQCDKERCLSLGALEYLQKPSNFADLVKLVADLKSRRLDGS